MNYKSIVLIALALCLCITVPVAAVWQNGNWIEDANAPSVQYDPVTGVSSKYATIVEETDLMSAAGLVYGNLKSGSVLEGGTRFLVSNDLYPESSKEFFFSPDGTFQDYFVEGNFTITLPQGTGSATGIDGSGNAHPEVAHVKVVSGQVSYFTFIGNSVASVGVGDETPVITIIKAEYCGETIPGYYTVVDADYIESGYWVWHWGWHWVDTSYYNGNCNKVGNHQSFDFKIDNQKYREAHHGKYTYTYHDAIHGGCACGVKQNIQDVVDMGVTTFKFDNAQNPGGIFSIGNDLLSQIDDPAPGIVKSVVIEYTVDGVEHNINTMEYETITLI